MSAIRARSLATLAAATAAVLSLNPVAFAVEYADAVGDNYGPSYVDIASVVVTNDATMLNFQINLNPAANLLAEDGSQVYGKYQIGFRTGEAGSTALANPFGNSIGISGGTGMDYWVGSWANGSATPPFFGDAQLHHFENGAFVRTAGQGTDPYVPVTVALTATSTTIGIPLASLGLAAGDSFDFDVWSTFDRPSGQSAYDAAGKSTQTTAPGTPWAPTPYDSSTAGPGGASTLLTYTVTGTGPVAATWTATGDGNFSAGSNWSGGTAPGGAGQAATFGPANAAPSTVTLDDARTLGTLTFDSPRAYTLAGTNALTLDATTGNGAVNVVSGNHVITAPLTLADDTTFTVTPAAGSLAVRGELTAAGRTVHKAGAGAVEFERVRAAALDVQEGAVRISTKPTAFGAAGTSTLSTLSVATGASLDLANNALVIDYAAGPIGTLADDVRQLISTGRLTSAGAPGNRSIGYVDNAVGTARATFGGVDVDTSSLLVGLTLRGDTNLDRTVNFDDLLALAQAYGTTSGATWQRGDVNHDAAVNFDDLLALAQNYGATALGAAQVSLVGTSFAADFALAQGLVPEPTSLLMIVASSGLLIRRRR